MPVHVGASICKLTASNVIENAHGNRVYGAYRESTDMPRKISRTYKRRVVYGTVNERIRSKLFKISK